MCAKVVQNHETKEQKAKNPTKFCYLLYTFAPDNEPLRQAGGSASGVL